MNGLAVVVKIFRCSGMNFQAADASGCERNLKKNIYIGRSSWCVRIFEFSNPYYINKGLPAYMTLGALALS